MFIEPYAPEMRSEWNGFVAGSRNGTFILDRGYMDYHSDRFVDASLMLRDAKGGLVGVLPASRSGDVVSSHAGLTYGGWILGRSKPDVIGLLEGFDLMKRYYIGEGARSLVYRPVPSIYHRYPCDEDLYVLFRENAVLDRVLVSSVVDLSVPLPFNKGARRHVNRAAGLGLSVECCDRYGDFWDVLELRLGSRYGARPVHSLGEISLLAGRFPDNIKLWVVRDASGGILAGTVLFLSAPVVKAQYISASDEGRRVNATDYLFYHLFSYYTAEGYTYFDLGPSCEDGGRRLNVGLISQKVGYGARGIVYNSYTLSLR